MIAQVYADVRGGVRTRRRLPRHFGTDGRLEVRVRACVACVIARTQPYDARAAHGRWLLLR
jgi:hypothetical protein